LILADLVYMPLLRPLLVLEPRWLLGETLAVAVALVPALAFARWTERDRHVHVRNAMWMFVFAGLPLAVIPLTILEVTHESLPRWRPHVTQPTVLYIAGGCGVCQSVRRLVERLRPDGVEIIPAEEHPTRDLERITYATRDGSFEAEGVQAVARVLEHVNFAF